VEYPVLQEVVIGDVRVVQRQDVFQLPLFPRLVIAQHHLVGGGQKTLAVRCWWLVHDGWRLKQEKSM
jgi:hypothetical protein